MTENNTAFDTLPIVDETKESKEQKQKKQVKDQEIDLVDINPEEMETTEDGALKQEGEEDFDPNDYLGYDMEGWNRYQGAITNKRQERMASLSKQSVYTVRYNAAPKDAPYPNFKYTSLQYNFITKSVWEQRRRELAEVEDLQRELQLQATRLAEMQQALQLRLFARNKPRGMITNREDPNKAQLEEIQNNVKFFNDFEFDIGKRIAEKQQSSDLAAFQMYFHKSKEIYDQIMNEDLDDILRACDWKQIHGSANLRLSKPSSSQDRSQGIS